MSKISLVLVFFFLLVSCKTQQKSESNKTSPTCITKAIEGFSKGSCEKGLKVNEYTFQGVSVFVFDQSKCGNDMTSEVFDKNCKSLGFLGGFIGNITINGEDFSNAVFVRTVWEN